MLNYSHHEFKFNESRYSATASLHILYENDTFYAMSDNLWSTQNIKRSLGAHNNKIHIYIGTAATTDEKKMCSNWVEQRFEWLISSIHGIYDVPGLYSIHIHIQHYQHIHSQMKCIPTVPYTLPISHPFNIVGTCNWYTFIMCNSQDEAAQFQNYPAHNSDYMSKSILAAYM